MTVIQGKHMQDTANDLPAVDILRSRILAGEEGMTHGFSTRTGGVSRVYRPWLPSHQGDLNLGFAAQDNAEHVRENRLRFLRALNAPELNRFALLRQMHTPNVQMIEHPDDAADDFTLPGTLEGDGLMTDQPGVLLAIGTADCIPVLLFDPARRVVAAFHAGWRGTLESIVEHGIGTMRLRYGSKPTDLRAAIGPGIGPASYVVSEELRNQFESRFSDAPTLFTEVAAGSVRTKKTAAPPAGTPGLQLHLDLWEANRHQLLNAGVRADHIDLLAQDTAADTGRFFSHRAENGFTGRMLSVIGLTA